MKVVFKFIRDRAVLLAVAALAVGLRLRAAPGTLADSDAVNFALALERFDLGLHQPHFPGYPIYVLAARAGACLLAPPLALVLPGALGAAGLVFAIRRAIAGRVGARGGWIAASLVAVAPPLVEVGALPGSDGLALAGAGCAFAVACVATEPLVDRRWLLFAGALGGLALGVRPSLLALAPSLLLLVALLATDRRGAAVALTVAGAAVAIVAWLAPLLWLVGAQPLLALGAAHVSGHFSTWGGSVISSPLGLGARALRLLVHTTSGLLGALVAALIVQGSLVASARLSGRVAGLLALLALPYAGWVWLAQQVERGRHAAPLALLLCVALALALAPRADGAIASWLPRLAPLLVLVQCLDGRLAAAQPAPWRRGAVAWIERRFGLERVLVVGTHLPRVAAYYQPALRTELARDGADVARIAAALGDGVTVVASSEIADLARPGLRLDPLARFGGATLYTAHAGGGGR